MDVPPEASDRYVGCMIGLAVGDAIGTTVEFKPRGSFEPLDDMIGGGPFSLAKGQWTDDTSMALCLAHSLVECDGFDPLDQMNRYLMWREEGYMSSRDTAFDIGGTTSDALDEFMATGKPYCGPTEISASGNGSLMRLAPIPLYFRHDKKLAIEMSGESSRTTHGSILCIEACRLFGAMLVTALSGAAKEDILLGHGLNEIVSDEIAEIAEGAYFQKDISAIRGTGYVVESLDAALWCFRNTDSFRDAVLAAANLGDDADTTAAICGQIAGAYYGIGGIPKTWVDSIYQGRQISRVARKLFRSPMTE